MSKRHQASRRRTYGRRQHEVRERTIRHRDHETYDVRVDTFGWQDRVDAFGFEGDAAFGPLGFTRAD